MPASGTDGAAGSADMATLGLSIEEGVVDDIVYRSDESGYTVCELAVSDDSVVIAVGIMPYLARGENVRMFGEWTRHPEYGEQLKVVRYETVAPRTEDAVLKYLSSGIVHGIGEKLASRIVARFGEDALRIMREEPDKLADIRGIGAEAAQRIADEMRDKQEYQELALLLSSFGIGSEKVLRIHRKYGSRALDIVRENPFHLADEIYGIGFHTADRIARSLNCAPDSPYRLRSAIRYVLGQAAAAGHTGLPEPLLIEQASGLLDRSVAVDDPDFIRMKTSGTIIAFNIGDTIRIALRSLYEAESGLAGRLAVLASCLPPPIGHDFDVRLEKLTVSLGVELAEEQQTAILQSMTGGVSVITGGPGTGKTTIIRVLCRLFGDAGKKVLLAAPTGQAAKRMSLAAGLEAKTIHRLLETQYVCDDRDDRLSGPRFRRDSSNPLDTDVLIVDEVSMADVLLLNSLLAALRPGARLILVGDADQLPSVGPGNVLRDILASGIVPFTRLLRIYRQADSGHIVANAHRINRGEYPEFDQRDDSDFLYIPRKTPEDMADAAVRLCANILSERYGYDPMRDIQVIAPSRKGPAGIPILNQALQAALNPRAAAGLPGLSLRGFRFSPGDRVMQISNDYELEWIDGQQPAQRGAGIFNGETGVIRSVNEKEGTLEVLFDEDRRVVYDRPLLDELEPAYAVTVHKSQGGEYPVVVLVLPPGPPMLLTRNLLYTAVTRAKERLFLISSGEILARTVANARRTERFTALGEFLKTAHAACEQSLPIMDA